MLRKLLEAKKINLRLSSVSASVRKLFNSMKLGFCFTLLASWPGRVTIKNGPPENDRVRTSDYNESTVGKFVLKLVGLAKRLPERFVCYR